MNDEMTELLVNADRRLTRLQVRRFRGLNDLLIEDTGRINLLVGRNDTGKTSLLEAIRLLLSGDPRHLRRHIRNRSERRPINLESYRLAFYQGRSKEPLHIEGSIGELRLAAQAEIREIQGEEDFQLEIENESDDPEAIESFLKPGHEIVVKVTANDRSVATIRQSLNDVSRSFSRSQRQFAGDAFPEIPPLVWLGTDRAEIWAYARRYSQLYRMGGEEILLNLLKDVEPRLKSLVVLTNRIDMFSANAVLEVDLGLSQPLPLESMGDGFSNMIAILSAVGAAKDGLCLIDEVENGIHYSLLTKTWRTVLSATNQYNSQIWAATHSYDCINAIHEALVDAPDALRVHRLDRKDDGHVAVHTFDHAMLGRALERGLEVR